MCVPRFLAVIAGAMLMTLPAPALARDYLGHRLAGRTVTIRSSDGDVVLTALSPEAVEVAYRPTGIDQLPSFALAATPPAVKVPVAVRDLGDRLTVQSGELTITIEKRPLRISYARGGQPLVAEERGLVVDGNKRGFRFRLRDGERLWGGGQRVLGMDRRGNTLPLDNRAAYGYGDRTDAMYYGVPAVLSDQRYLLLFDNSARGEMDLGKTEPGIMRMEAKGGRTAYVVVAGPTYADVVRNYVGVTGHQPLPPRWAFGNMASRFGYRSEAAARDVVDRFAKAKLPLDGIIFDLFWFGPDIKGHMGNLDWDRRAFPHPDTMIADFKQRGVNTILITEPFVLQSSKRWQEALSAGALARGADGKPRTFDFYFGRGGLIDVFDPDAAKWFWAKNAALLDQGVAGIWGDLGEPEMHPSDIRHAPGWSADSVHNAYGHQWARILDENWRRTRPGERPFVMMRSGFAGSQRYGIIPWSGDVSRSWKALQAQVEIALQMGVMGLAYSHSDLGGFVALDPSVQNAEVTLPFDRELYIRWLQFGAFQPVFRPHSQEQIASEPVFHDAGVQAIVGRYIRWRYRLLPYLYTAAWQNSRTGLPMMRPVAFAGDDARRFEDQSAFLWGDDLLVAPVTEAGARTKRLWLPAGRWFDFWSGRPVAGGREVEVPVTLDDIPVFVRAGAFVPTIGDIMTTRDYRTDRLTIHHYHDAAVVAPAGRMYDDDGRSPDAERTRARDLLTFAAAATPTGRRFTFDRSAGAAYAGRPATRRIEFVVHDWPAAPARVALGGKALGAEAWRYDAAARRLTLTFDWKRNHEALTID